MHERLDGVRSIAPKAVLCTVGANASQRDRFSSHKCMSTYTTSDLTTRLDTDHDRRPGSRITLIFTFVSCTLAADRQER